MRGASLGSLLVGAVAVWSTTRGRGPFASSNLNDSLILLETFLILCAISGLVFAADRHERLRLERRSLRRDLLAPWLVLLGCLGVAIGGWHSISADTERAARERFDAQAAQIERRIAGRMQDYEQVLRGAAGLFAASVSVERAEWQAYVARLQVEQNYPGIQAIGFARAIEPAALDAHERELRAEGFAEYAVRPPGARERYSAIVFIEPFDARNRRAFGFDMTSEPVRRAAMQRSRDSGAAAMSGKVRLLQETATDVQAGTLMCLPVYRNGAPTDTVQQRRDALLGWVYSPFRMNNMMRGVLGEELRDVALRLVGGAQEGDDAPLLYDSAPQRTAPAYAAFTSRRAVPVPGGGLWTAEITALSSFEATIDRQKAQIVLIAGVVFSLLLFTLVRSLTMTRERAVLLAEDMTGALRASERAARDAEQQLRAVMNASPAGVVFTDAAGHLVFGNPSYLRIAGLALDEAERDGWSRAIHPDDLGRVRAQWQAVVRGDGSGMFDDEYRYLHADGRVVWARARSAAISDGAGITGHVAIIEDITARRATDALLAAKNDALVRSNRELEQFAYVASHDLQEPLRMVGSYSQLLMRRHRERMPDEAQEFLDFIADGAKRAQALIADLLALARLDSRARPFEPVAMRDVLDDALGVLRGAVADSGATITAADALPEVLGDRRQLAQVLQNLIGNALKFRGAEPPRVHVSAAREAGAWRISVRDNGIGIDARFHERIFTLFQRLHARDDYPGTGIGLAICRKVVERHGGSIGVQSAPGKGSTFFFTIAAGAQGERANEEASKP